MHAEVSAPFHAKFYRFCVFDLDYGLKSKKVTLSGQQRRKGASKQKACCKSFFDPLNPYFALIDKCQLYKLPDSF